ncbi:MAG: hypothetical protein V7724_17535 [Sediminicola sp.]|tara:strand:- start:80888 stop:81196 length:309 start_codon:yes stop_codon:yes gene_type:complete
MKNGRLKNSITYLFLVIFLCVKMAGLHVLTHTEDKDHIVNCALCDHALAHDQTPAILSDLSDTGLKRYVGMAHTELSRDYHFTNSGAIAKDQLFSRPPPSFL